MNEPRTPDLIAPRRMILAVLLSLLGPGIGHLYAGRGRRGVILMAIALGHVPTLALLSTLPAAGWIVYAVLLLVILEIGVVLYALVDAALCARRAAVPFRGRAYNQAGLYVLLFVLSFGWSVMGAQFVRDNAFQVYEMATRSMEPTIVDGDRVLVNKFQVEALRRGDLVIFRAPGKPGHAFIKRVIGLPGEALRLEEGGVSVDGKQIRAVPVAPDEAGDGLWRESVAGRSFLVRRAVEDEARDVAVPDGHVFVLGDNRPNSYDSRRFGPVPLDDVLGIAQYVYTQRPEGTRLGLLD